MKKILIGSAASIVVFVAGLILRVKAVALAWPAEWRYEGERANTVWAQRESLYIDISLVLMAFGVLLLVASLSRWLFVDGPPKQKTPKWEAAAKKIHRDEDSPAA